MADKDGDCRFIVEGHSICAHKSILKQCSPVFEKMFYGDLATDVVPITDITLANFKQLLSFVYKERTKLELNSVIDAWDMYYAGHKYLLKDLCRACASYIESNLTLDTLVLSYEFADLYGAKETKDKIMNDLCNFYRGLFGASSDYYHMKVSTLIKILQQPSINASNLEICKGIVTWGWYQCELTHLENTAANVVGVLDDFGLLKIMHQLNMKMTDIDLEPIDGPLEKIYAQKHWCILCRSRQIFKIASRIDIRKGDILTSRLYANRNVLLYGVVIMTLDDKTGGYGYYDGSISIQIGRNVTKFSSRTLPYSTQIYVPLAQLVTLETDVVYEIGVSYERSGHGPEGSSPATILTHYMNPKLVDHRKRTTFTFDEVDGSVVSALCYYPL